ncbi:hypothetical protein Tco_1577440 [Tanacetum coccineum]
MGVPKIMKISSFMDAHKCPEFAKRYFDKVSKTVDEMIVRLDDYVQSKKAFANTELLKGDASDLSKKVQGLVHTRDVRFLKGNFRIDRRRNDGQPCPLPTQRPPSSIPTTKGRLSRTPMQTSPKKENQDKYCGHHGEKGHYTNDCFQLKRQLELALESGKLNHLVKDGRKMGLGGRKGKETAKDKVINMIPTWP